MNDDQHLLHEYANHGSGQALDELVRKYLGLVYAAALRQVRNPHLAEDVSQAVFLILTQKCRTIHHGEALGGWLLAVTRCTSVNAMKRDAIQKKHELLAVKPETSQAADQWGHLEPFLDQELSSLPKADRDAIVLRFFEELSFPAMALQLGISEKTARNRVGRALTRLRSRIARRNTSLTVGALAILLATHALQAAPKHLNAQWVVERIANPQPHCLSLAKGALKMIAYTKARLLGAVAASVVIGIFSATLASQWSADGSSTPAQNPPVETHTPANEGAAVDLAVNAPQDEPMFVRERIVVALPEQTGPEELSSAPLHGASGVFASYNPAAVPEAPLPAPVAADLLVARIVMPQGGVPGKGEQATSADAGVIANVSETMVAAKPAR